MKARILILFFLPIVCFAQTNQQAQTEKPSTDACPTWNQKSKSASKAEYFQFLKSNKAKDNKTTYTTNSGGGTYSITRSTSVEPRTARGKKIRTNTNSAANKKEESAEKVASNESVEEEKKEEAVVEKEVAVSEKEEEAPTQAKEEVEIKEKTVEKEVVAEEKALADESEKDKPVVNAEKLKHETKIKSRKIKRFFTRKNKGGKGKAAKCPDF